MEGGSGWKGTRHPACPREGWSRLRTLHASCFTTGVLTTFTFFFTASFFNQEIQFSNGRWTFLVCLRNNRHMVHLEGYTLGQALGE